MRRRRGRRCAAARSCSSSIRDGLGSPTKADPWLRVRPGTDAALALAITNVMIERGWYDEAFVRRWTNGPLLVRSDTGRLLRASDLSVDGDSGHYVAWDEVAGQPIVVDPGERGGCDVEDHDRLALAGAVEVPTAMARWSVGRRSTSSPSSAARFRPTVAEEITGVPAAEIERAAQVLWEHRPVAFYTWSGLEQHSGTTQIIRAINVLYALTGCFDAPGGNVLFTPVPTNPIAGAELLDPAQRAKAIGVSERPLGPARFEFVTGEDFYTAALEGRPYRPRGLVSFGSNLLMAHGDSARGRDALQTLDFHVHLDLFMSPTAEQADIVLPVTGAFEAEGLKVGFEISQEAQSLVQLRAPLVPPVGEARSDIEIIFDLATRLGLGEQFFDGNVDAGWEHQLAPSGVTLEQLRADPAGVRLPLETRHRKYAAAGGDGVPAGFATPTGRIELYVEAFLDIGQPPVPTFTEPALSPRSRPDLADDFPLVLTCTKALHFCETQHRQVASLRRHLPDPQVELHPDTAAARGIAEGTWVEIKTPKGGGAGSRRVQRHARPERRERTARLVRTVRGARPARLPALRSRQRQPQPGAQPDTERPDQRQLTPAGPGLRRDAPRRGPRSPDGHLKLTTVLPAADARRGSERRGTHPQSPAVELADIDRSQYIRSRAPRSLIRAHPKAAQCRRLVALAAGTVRALYRGRCSRSMSTTLMATAPTVRAVMFTALDHVRRR